MKLLLQTLITMAFLTPSWAQNVTGMKPQSPPATIDQNVGPNPKCKELSNVITAMSKLTYSQTVYNWENPDWVQNYIGPAEIINGKTQTSYHWICPGTNHDLIEFVFIKGNASGLSYTGAMAGSCDNSGCQVNGFERTGTDIKSFIRTTPKN